MEEYYVNQAGSGYPFYRGMRYQRGHGFFGRLISGTVLPLLRYLGKQALSSAGHVAADVASGENFKSSLKKRGREAGSKLLRAGAEKLDQTGKGIKRKRIKECVSPQPAKRVYKKKNCPKKIHKKKYKKSSFDRYSFL